MVAPDASTNDAGILDGIRIVDLSDGIAGPVSTLLLAEAGADVVAVEPPGGLHLRGDAGFHTWLRSKRSVVLDVDQPDDRARLDDLLAAADVVVHNYGPTRARELGLDDATLAGPPSPAHRVVDAVVAGEPCRRRHARSTSSSRSPASACSTSSRATATGRSSSAAPSGAGARHTSAPSGSWPA